MQTKKCKIWRNHILEGLSQTSTPKLKLFKLSRLTLEIFRISKYIKGGYDLTKFGCNKMGGLSQTGFPKFKIFDRLNQKAKIFRTSDYEKWRMAKFFIATL